MNKLILISFICYLLINGFNCNDLKNNNNYEEFKENVTIYRLSHKYKFLLNYELDIIIDNNLKLEHSKFITNELLELSYIPLINELLVTSTQGNWRKNNWGEPPIVIYNSGTMLDFNFNNINKVTNNIWSIILSKFTNLICTSLNVFTDNLFREKNCININDNNNMSDDYNRIICYNYDDTFCSDNLNCWKKLLPCHSFNMYNKIGSYGILKSISTKTLIKSSYKSIGIKIKKESNKSYYKLFLQIVLSNKNLSLDKNLELWNFWNIHNFDELSTNDVLCPIINESNVYYFLNNISSNNIELRNKYFKDQIIYNNIVCDIVSYNHSIHDNLYYLKIILNKLDYNDIKLNIDFFKYKCGLYWINNLYNFISQLPYNNILNNIDNNFYNNNYNINNYNYNNNNLNILEAKRTFSGIINKNTMNYDTTIGRLIISFYNPTNNKIINICHWEKFPKYLNIWFYKTKVLLSRFKIKNIDYIEKNSQINIIDSIEAIRFLNLNILFDQDITINFCIDIPSNTNIIIIMMYQKSYVTLDYIGSKSQRGQITPPSITLWNINSNNIENNNDFKKESNIYYHNSHIISTINVDHTMKFNVVAITSALMIFGIITTTKFVQLNNKNIS